MVPLASYLIRRASQRVRIATTREGRPRIKVTAPSIDSRNIVKRELTARFDHKNLGGVLSQTSKQMAAQVIYNHFHIVERKYPPEKTHQMATVEGRPYVERGLSS